MVPSPSCHLRVDYSLPKTKTDHGTDATQSLPVLSQHVDRIIAASSSKTSHTTATCDNTTNNIQQQQMRTQATNAQDDSSGQQTSEDGGRRRTASAKGNKRTGKILIEKNNSSTKDVKSKGNNPINIPRVNEILVQDSKLDSGCVLDSRSVDTNKLWVQNPYDEDEYDDDDDDEGDDNYE
ncbi:hypothetical protein PoB_000564300 [Plakobranchus ocellatus]|uniref:Uncharacterized protein n=1 Tax=Plakobranchus ocellatus TaxID=259542 RepID=A0AAV3Y9K2_9GAST|nr:hypothetical protein PoB_000564300 [Plakobranchus ocellatus]